MICNKCGSQIPDRSDFCLRCGTKVMPEAPQPEEIKPKDPIPEKPKKSKKSPNIGIIAGIIVLVGVLAVMGFMYFNKKSDNKEAATEQNSEMKQKLLGEWHLVSHGFEDSSDVRYFNMEQTWTFNEDNTLTETDTLGGTTSSSNYKYETTDNGFNIIYDDGMVDNITVEWRDNEMYTLDQGGYYRIYVRDLFDTSIEEKLRSEIIGEWKINGYQNPEDSGSVNNFTECPGTITFNEDGTYIINITDTTANTKLESHSGHYMYHPMINNDVTLWGDGTTEGAYAIFVINPWYIGDDSLCITKDTDPNHYVEGGIHSDTHETYFLYKN